MYYLQSRRFKILIFTVTLLFLTIAGGSAQDYGLALDRADSLFSRQKYTQSYNIYDSIMNVGKLSSPKMLLRMAYIKEGLGDYTTALIHLNEYYVLTSDERALAKMENLGEMHNLTGYDYSESDFVLSVYHDYHNQIILVLSLFALIFLAGILYQKFKLKEKPIANFVLFSITLVILAVVINSGLGYREGIITHPNSYLLSGPSSSSKVLAIIPEGNKIPISKSQDVWLKTRWENKPAYIKSKNVTPITTR